MDTPTGNLVAGIQMDWSQQMPDGTRLHISRIKGPLAEMMLAVAWLEMGKAKLLQTIWPGGVPSISFLFEWAAREDTMAYAGFTQSAGSEDVDFVGTAWTNSLQSAGMDEHGRPCSKAEIGFCFLPKVHGTGIPQDLAEAMLDDVFHRLNLVAAYGTIPTVNKLAIRFGARLGFNSLAILPKYGVWPDEQGIPRPTDCQVSVMTRDQWISRGVDDIDAILSRCAQQEVA